MKTLRKVNFWLEKDPGYGLFDITDEEQKVVNEKIKQRRGFFHEWGSEIVTEGDDAYQNSYGIVEEQDTGIVYQVAPKNIQFN